MKISPYHLFFCRFTPDQSLFDAQMTDFSDYKKKIYAICNESYSARKQKLDHQMVGVFERSDKGVLHFHFILLLPLSTNFVRDKLKERLNAYGNKQISVKQYDYTQESFDTSCAYMSKGDHKTELYHYFTKEQYFENKGLDHYVLQFKSYGNKTDDDSKKAEKYKKFKFFKGIVYKYLEKLHKSSKLKLDTTECLSDILKWYNYDELRKICFKSIVHHFLNEKVFYPMSQIAEMSVWIALEIKHSHGIDVDDIITEISNKKNEKFQDIKE